jgi:uncharacterized repeat protein (TIGR02543 family)
MSLNPVSVANRFGGDAVYSLGRSPSGDFFNGSYDYFNVYFQATDAPAYTYTEVEEVQTIFTITFNEDYEGAPAATTLETRDDGTLANNSLPTPTREGYTFEGWWFAPGDAGEDVRVTTGRTSGTVFTEDTTVRARWAEVAIVLCVLCEIAVDDCTCPLIVRTTEVVLCDCGEVEISWRITTLYELCRLTGTRTVVDVRRSAKRDSGGGYVDEWTCEAEVDVDEDESIAV